MRSILILGAVLASISMQTVWAQDRGRTVLRVGRHDPVAAAVAPGAAVSADDVLRSARVLYVASTSQTFDPADLESEIVNLKAFSALGLALTRDPAAADLIVEARQGEATITLGYTLLDVRTRAVVGGGKATSIFGQAPKMVAKDLVGKIEKARKRR